MKKIYFLIGVKRSGNHAILNWLYKIIPNYVHLNNMRFPLFTEANYKQNLTTGVLEWNYRDNIWIPFTEQHNILISFENQDVIKLSKRINEFCTNLNLEPVIIYLLRNPHNMLASVWKINNMNPNILNNHLVLWLQYAEEYLNKKLFPNSITILFDRWFADQNYRKDICKKLGFAFNDSNFGKMYKHGTSSFDDMKYANNAEQMDVLNRQAAFKNDQTFLKLTGNKKIGDQWAKIMEKENIKK